MPLGCSLLRMYLYKQPSVIAGQILFLNKTKVMRGELYGYLLLGGDMVLARGVYSFAQHFLGHS